MALGWHTGTRAGYSGQGASSRQASEEEGPRVACSVRSLLLNGGQYRGEWEFWGF